MSQIPNLTPGVAILGAAFRAKEGELADKAKNLLGVTPDTYHDGDASPSIVLKALAAGKRVLSEKPIAPDVASGTDLVSEYSTKYSFPIPDDCTVED
ncbi:hypothetical protein BJ138DRAFT_1119176 [Hygrophoropsis aurantiaca]|uniref:Uncharacterized protein n=1 Tax=Hygrophoropsis aurantiaca TaxID=72124 RepID=A0ACB7ZV73_9AGAM|nr:hypothetical protein BJ138DRAFT_1119176 [Hygrophoropsis aurantiaca]